MKSLTSSAAIVGLSFLCLSLPRAAHACNSPLILDLNGDGIHTTSIYYPVQFDLDADGSPEVTAWTDPATEEGLLWLDLNGNGRPDNGRELFGTSTLMPSGVPARNGFDALSVYDLSESGGNGDGLISAGDLVWFFLRLWIDRNHDGAAQRNEIDLLDVRGVKQIELEYALAEEYDPSNNLHLFQGGFMKRIVRRLGPPYLRRQVIHDVYFRESE